MPLFYNYTLSKSPTNSFIHYISSIFLSLYLQLSSNSKAIEGMVQLFNNNYNNNSGDTTNNHSLVSAIAIVNEFGSLEGELSISNLMGMYEDKLR